MASTDAPTRERGVVSNQPQVPFAGRLGGMWASVVDEAEQAPQLRWPKRTGVFEQMLDGDSQVDALRLAVTLPLKRRRRMIDPNGADERIVAHVAGDLGLPVVGRDHEPRRMDPRRFSFARHLHHVLLAPFMGHYFFAQFAPIGPDGLAHLAKLLPLPPRTISEVKVADDGGLEYVRQWIGRKDRRDPYGRPEPIPVEGLVAYVWEQEAGNWLGRSMLRSIYRDWLAKDDLIRTNMIMLRRNGMGVPTAMQTDKSADGTQLAAVQKIAQAWRAGEDASAGLPFGYDIRIRGVEGTLPDAVPSIKLHDEAMARRFLAMFVQLGQTQTGSRALGESFIDFFALALDAIDQELVCDTTTLHVIRDLAEWNFGDVDLVPLLVSERDEAPELLVADMVQLIDKGALTVDADFEDYLRARYRLPDRRTPEQGSQVAAMARGERKRGREASAAAREGEAGLPGNRDPLPHEEMVNWSDLNATWQAERAALVASWLGVREAQIADLAAQIQAAGTDLATLATLDATPLGEALIAAAMQRLAALGVSTAVQEATNQGASLAEPDMTSLNVALSERASALSAMLSRSLSEVAARRAIERTGGSLAPAEVATEVADYLRGLSNAFLEQELGGALTQGLNTGRRKAMGAAPAGTRFFASALLDPSVCTPCSWDDGKEFDTLAVAELQFPVGGNKDCEGGVRCRCTIVAQYPESAPSVL